MNVTAIDWFTKRFMLLTTVLLLFGLLSGCLLVSEENSSTIPTDTLTVYYLDVGQGDATLFVGPDFTLLIDAGRHDRQDMLPYLESMGIEQIDLMVGTHPHADHIGQMSQIIEKMPVQEVWLSGDIHTSKTFERLIDTILEHDINYYEPRAGESFELGSALIEVLNPTELTGDFHEGCLALKVTYGEVSFLFTGDIEKQTEEAMLVRNEPVEATIFQLGHHGSSTSNTEKFLRAVNPDLAIYSAEKGNSYGHPHREVMELLADLDIPVYGTDKHGTIRVITDGQQYSLELER